jgi:cobalt-zinc-cadmium efflux system outer membrane protein
MRQGFIVIVAFLWWVGVGSPVFAGPTAPTAHSDLIEPEYEMTAIVDLALKFNPAIAGAEANLQQSEGQRIIAGAYPNPTILGQTGGGAIRDPSTGGSINEYLLTLNQPVEWFGKRSARKREADAGIGGAVLSVEEAKLNLVAEVKIAFYDLLFSQRAYDLAKQNQEIVEDVARIVRARVKSGEAPQFESIKAQVEVLKANQVTTRAQNYIRVNRVALDTLTSGQLGPAYRIRGDFEVFPKYMDVNVLSAKALERHPTILRLQKLVERAGLTLVKEQESRVPDVTVFGGYAREIGREAVVGGVSLPTPIWYLRQGEIASALGAKRREEAELLRGRNELLRAVNQHFQEAQTTAHMIEVFEEGLLKQAQEALRIAEFSFQQGARSLLEVLDAQRVQWQVKMDYVQARHALSLSMARLERAVAGLL